MNNLFDTPDPPDPRQTAASQTASNVSTALANATLGNVNQVTPQGNLSFNISGYSPFTDPASGHTYNIPQYTATQTNTPMGQAILDQTQAAQLNLGTAANEQSNFLRSYLSQHPGTAGLPAAGNPNQLAASPGPTYSIGASGNPQFGIGDAGDISNTFGAAPDIQQNIGYDDNFSTDRQRVEDSLMGRLNPSLAIERNKYEQQLADQGIRYGSPAYDNAMRNYSMQANDARLAAIQQAGQEQQRMFGMATARGEFFNKAQQQAFEQAKARGQFGNEAQQQYFAELLGRGQFYNQAQQQQFGQNAAASTFYNAAAAQDFQKQQSVFNSANAARQQALQEQFAYRNQPINEITALLSGSQVSHPNFINANMPTIPTTDVAGIINRNFDQQMAAFNSASANTNNLIGGLFGFGGNVLRSDREVKHDVHKLGSVWGVSPDGEDKKLPIYSYKYDDDPAQRTRVGPMAQDVEKIDKSAVVKIGGVRHIKTQKLGELLKVA